MCSIMLARGRSLFTIEEWKKFLIRSIGLEPEALSPRAQDIILLTDGSLCGT